MKKKFIIFLCAVIAMLTFILAPACMPDTQGGEDIDGAENIAWYTREDDWDAGLVFGVSSDEAFTDRQVTKVENNLSLNYDWLTDEQKQYYCGGDFFRRNRLLLVQFKYCTGEGNIEFSELTTHENKFYPVIYYEHQGEPQNDVHYMIFMIEISVTLSRANYEGDVLVIDETANKSTYVKCSDSRYHRGVDGMFGGYPQIF